MPDVLPTSYVKIYSLLRDYNNLNELALNPDESKTECLSNLNGDRNTVNAMDPRLFLTRTSFNHIRSDEDHATQ